MRGRSPKQEAQVGVIPFLDSPTAPAPAEGARGSAPSSTVPPQVRERAPRNPGSILNLPTFAWGWGPSGSSVLSRPGQATKKV